MDSANSTIPLRGLQYLLAPEPTPYVERSNEKYKLYSTILTHTDEKDNKNKATLPLLSGTQCCENDIKRTTRKLKHYATQKKESNNKLKTNDLHPLELREVDCSIRYDTSSAENSRTSTTELFANTLSQFSRGTRQMLHLDKTHNSTNLFVTLEKRERDVAYDVKDHFNKSNPAQTDRANTKTEIIDTCSNNSETNCKQSLQHKNRTMPIISTTSHVLPPSLSLCRTMNARPLRQTCKDYCFTSLSTTLSRLYTAPPPTLPPTPPTLPLSATATNTSQRRLLIGASNNHEHLRNNVSNTNNTNTNICIDDKDNELNENNKNVNVNNDDNGYNQAKYIVAQGYRYSNSNNINNNTVCTNKSFDSTLIRKASMEPPLVKTLRAHIMRELSLVAQRRQLEQKNANPIFIGANDYQNNNNKNNTTTNNNNNNICLNNNDTVNDDLLSTKRNSNKNNYSNNGSYDINASREYNEFEMLVIDQLLPYREAFMALRSALPGYELLLEEIQVAYDRVIKAQAELLTDAYAKEAIKEFTSEEEREEAIRLRQHVNDLTATLNKMSAELEARQLAASAAYEDEWDGNININNNNYYNNNNNKNNIIGSKNEKVTKRSRSALAKARSDYFEAMQKLQLAEQRIAKLEMSSKGDLEKILVLIGAVRECDRRLKSYEQTVKTMSGQIEELDEFKRLAAEAQAELERYKERYECFVSLSDFELMRQHLTDELASSQAMARRLRRTAAVRGTQIEVMQRRLSALEEELAAALQVRTVSQPTLTATLPTTQSTEKQRTPAQILTPRPNWAAVHRRIHEMAEDLKPIHCSPLPRLSLQQEKETEPRVGDKNMSKSETTATATATIDKQGNISSNTEVSKAKELPSCEEEEEEEEEEKLIVDAPKETALQVEMLVDQVINLQRQVKELTYTNGRYETWIQKLSALPQITCTLAIDKVTPNYYNNNNNNNSNNNNNNNSNFINVQLYNERDLGNNVQQRQPGKPHDATVQPSSATIAALASESRNEVENVLEAEYFKSNLSSRLQVMQSTWILGPGNGLEVPAYLRICGSVERIIIAPKTKCRLIYHFFSEVLQPLFTEPYNASSTSALAELFATFLESQVEEEDSLSHFTCNAHLALNLEVDSNTNSLTNPPLTLLFNILHHRMPVRLAIDAVEVVSHAMSDISALAREQRKARLRRGAISESLILLLELMTPNEIAELRVALGPEVTFDAVALASIDSRFMRTLFYQACQSSMDLYANLVEKLTMRSTIITNEEHSRNQVISTNDVAEVVLATEPRTPEIVIRELTENALKSYAQSDDANNKSSDSGSNVHDSNVETRLLLGEVIKAVGESPIIRRSAQSLKEECVL